MTRRRAAAGLVVAIVLAGCGTEAADPYFEEPDRTEVATPAGPEELLYVGVAWLVAMPGDDVRLSSAEPLEPSLAGAAVTWHVLQVSGPDDTLTIGVASPGDELAERLVELAGAAVATGPREFPTQTTQVVVGVRASSTGTVTFEAVRLRFTVNGSERVQDFPMAVVLCVDDPKPSACARPSG